MLTTQGRLLISVLGGTLILSVASYSAATAAGVVCQDVTVPYTFTTNDQCRPNVNVGPDRNTNPIRRDFFGKTFELTRTYRLCVPGNLQLDADLLVVFPGGGSGSQRTGASFQERTRWDELGSEFNYISVFPTGCTTICEPGGVVGTICEKPAFSCTSGNLWSFGSEPARFDTELCGIDDDGFVAGIIDSVRKQYDIKNIYAVGYSAGANIAYKFGCDFSDQVKAILPIAGTLVDATCELTDKVSLFDVHGEDDPDIPVAGGGPFFDYPPDIDGLDFYAAANGCQLPIGQPGSGDLDASLCRQYDCSEVQRDGAPVAVEYCLLPGLTDSYTNLDAFWDLRSYFASRIYPGVDQGKKISPVLECVDNLGGGFLEAHFGYLNDNSQTVRVPVGSDNKFTPPLNETPASGDLSADPLNTPYLSAPDAGETNVQTIGFRPGRVRGVFDVTFRDGQVVVWTLQGPDGRRRTSTASNNPAQRCK